MSHGVKLYSNATMFAFVNLGKKKLKTVKSTAG